MTRKQHKMFLTTCDLGEHRPVSAADCSNCPHGSVVDNKSRVLCHGETKFFLAPCFYEMRAAATMYECESCRFGEIGEDRLRVFCSRM